MKITINGTIKEFNDSLILSDLINQYCKEPKHIITELNGQIVISDNWSKTSLNEGDKIELVAFVGGG